MSNGTGCYSKGGSEAAFVLVLFILLVIILAF